MSLDPYSQQAAAADFDRARFLAALGHVLARLTRASDELLSYEEVARQLHLAASSERGVQAIPVAAIVGSVGRATDFTRSFLPRRAEDRERWVRVRNAFLDPNRGGLPAIDVYKVGEAYFVLDGNHRVSVARREGVTYIEAHVIEIESPVPFTPNMTPDDLICQAEFVTFLDETGLGDPGFGFDFRVARCGQYSKLRAHITAHQQIVRRTGHRELDFRQAAADWLATVYAPLVHAIREHDLLEWFPDHTETDLYLWVSEHQEQLQAELGWEIRPGAAIQDLAVQSGPRAKSSATAPGKWQKERLAERYLGHLFNDILVPLTNSPGAWNALGQALVIAARENAIIHGLHIVRRLGEKTGAPVQALQTRLLQRCEQANVRGELAVETGSLGRKICERALLTDLVILDASVANAPSRVQALLSVRGSHTTYILKHVARPILFAAREPSLMQRALVVFDGSLPAQEALFIGAYMGENWKTALTVLVVPNGSETAGAALNHARMYLDLHELEADYVSGQATNEDILQRVADHKPDLLLLGKETLSSRQGVRGQDRSKQLLRELTQPMLICA